MAHSRTTIRLLAFVFSVATAVAQSDDGPSIVTTITLPTSTITLPTITTTLPTSTITLPTSTITLPTSTAKSPTSSVSSQTSMVSSPTSMVSSPTSTTTSPTGTTTSPTSTITSTPAISSISSTSDTPLSLWGVANSLLSKYYPSSSTTLTQVASLTWPATVVIDSSTYSVHPGSTSAPAATGSATSATSLLAEQTSATSSPTKSPSNNNNALHTDAKIGIAIGVVVGLIAIAVLALAVYCLHRRRKTTGTYFKHRPHDAETTILSPTSPSHEQLGSYNNGMYTNDPPIPPPMAMHPAMRHQEGEAIPFLPALQKDLGVPSSPDRPPTPFAPGFMMSSGTNKQPAGYSDPFASPEDQDTVSPILPPRNPERRYSPMIHYPSWDEISEFDFTGQGGGGRDRYKGSAEGGRGRESVVGRTELA